MIILLFFATFRTGKGILSLSDILLSLKPYSWRNNIRYGEYFIEKCYFCKCQREKSSDKGALAFLAPPKIPAKYWFQEAEEWNALFFRCLCRTAFLAAFPITNGRRDDVSSTVFLMGLLAGALGGYQRATESPRLSLCVTVSGRLTAMSKPARWKKTLFLY